MASTTSTTTSDDTKATTSTRLDPAITSESLTADLASSKLFMQLSLDLKWDGESKSWTYTGNANPDDPAEHTMQPVGSQTKLDCLTWNQYCFVVVRKYSKPSEDSDQVITFLIFLMSPYIIKACQNVMGDAIRGVSWNSEPIELTPEILIAYFPRLEKYEQDLVSRTDRKDYDDHVLKSLGILLAHMRKHYGETLTRIATLVKNHEITFNLLYAILLPGTVIIQRCPITHEPRALKLLSISECCSPQTGKYLILLCEYLEFTTGKDEQSRQDIGWGDKVRQPIQFGMLDVSARIMQFHGAKTIESLAAYPLELDSNPKELKTMLLERAYMWVSLCGVHNVYYKGSAIREEPEDDSFKLRRYSIRSRIMVDKASFSRLQANYRLPNPTRMFPPRATPENGAYGLTDVELLLAPPVVYGFSLTDKLWLEFNINYVAPIIWNDEAFDELVLPPEHKVFLHGLIEAHSRFHLNVEGPMCFDDFVPGKGRGLVINLFGPPGVGKTLSAQATSEHLRRPLYVLGSGDLEMSARTLNNSLREAFDLAVAWRAVVLIDEVDVFLERRSLPEIERNAAVAVFLHHIEYYCGILFIATNRIQVFDKAFLSRIHVTMRFDKLGEQAKMQIWRVSLRKAGLKDACFEERLLLKLAAHDINGRQINNVCRTARSLADSCGEQMGYKHLEQVLSVTEEFLNDCEQITY